LRLSEQAQAAETSAAAVNPEVIQFSRNGWMPNNEHLPVLLYQNAVSVRDRDPAALIEAQFERNSWPPQWRDSMYNFSSLSLDGA
jgi:uncharacterized protein YjlB